VSILTSLIQTVSLGSTFVQPNTSYTLTAPLNSSGSAHTGILPPILTFNPPSKTYSNANGQQTDPVAGSLLVTITGSANNQVINQGATVTTGGVLVNDTNSEGLIVTLYMAKQL
jgi:hypothetical protein